MNPRVLFRHKVELDPRYRTVTAFADKNGVTVRAIHRLLDGTMKSASLEKAVADFMGYPTWHDFITSHSPTGGRS